MIKALLYTTTSAILLLQTPPRCPHCPDPLVCMPCCLDAVPDCCDCCLPTADCDLLKDPLQGQTLLKLHDCITRPADCVGDSFPTLEFVLLENPYNSITPDPKSLVYINNGVDKYPSTICCTEDSFKKTCPINQTIDNGCCFQTGTMGDNGYLNTPDLIELKGCHTTRDILPCLLAGDTNNPYPLCLGCAAKFNDPCLCTATCPCPANCTAA